MFDYLAAETSYLGGVIQDFHGWARSRRAQRRAAAIQPQKKIAKKQTDGDEPGDAHATKHILCESDQTKPDQMRTLDRPQINRGATVIYLS